MRWSAWDCTSVCLSTPSHQLTTRDAVVTWALQLFLLFPDGTAEAHTALFSSHGRFMFAAVCLRGSSLRQQWRGPGSWYPKFERTGN